MAKKLIRFNAKLATANIATKTMHSGNVNGKSVSAEYYVIENVCHMIRNSVMNGILYTADNFDSLSNYLMTSNANIPAPLSHPSDENGGFVDANDPITYPAHNIGAFDSDWRVNGDKLISNTYIPVDSIDNPKPDNKWFSDSINNKQSIDRSTGLYLNIEDSEGFGPDGEPYAYKTTEIYELNHSAILNPEIEPGAKSNGEAVGMFTNKKGECEINDVDLVVNASSPAMNLPLAPSTSAWNESQAIQNIRAYTDSVDKPSSNYRKFFLEFNKDDAENFDSYQQPFADIIDGVPNAFKSPIENASDNSYAKAYMNKFNDSSDGMIMNAWNKLKSIFKTNELSHEATQDKIYKKLNEGKQGKDYCWPYEIYADYFIYRGDNDKLYSQQYNLVDDEVIFNDQPSEVERIVEYKQVFNNQNGDRIMRDKILAALNAANEKTDGLDDDALMAAYNKLQATPVTKTNSEDIAALVTTAVNSAIKPLQDQINANADKELTQSVDAVVALNKGIDKDTATAMGLKGCNNFLAANGQAPFNVGASQHQSATNDCGSLELPEGE